jgi:hypothetical protein
MASFKYSIVEKLKKALGLAFFVLIIWVINYVFWSAGETFVLFSILFLILVKLIAIPLHFFQAENKLEKRTFLFFALLLTLFTASMFDFVVVPDLWVDKFGVSTEGTAIDFSITHAKGTRYFITYEFNANKAAHTKSQSVSISLYENLKSSPSTQIKYLSGHPDISYLRDVENLKENTLLDLFSSMGVMFLLYFDEIENGFDKIGKVFNAIALQRKP